MAKPTAKNTAKRNLRPSLFGVKLLWAYALVMLVYIGLASFWMWSWDPWVILALVTGAICLHFILTAGTDPTASFDIEQQRVKKNSWLPSLAKEIDLKDIQTLHRQSFLGDEEDGGVTQVIDHEGREVFRFLNSGGTEKLDSWLQDRVSSGRKPNVSK